MPYLPLDPSREEIRVLSIVASDDSSKPVECSLEQVSLQDKTPVYSDYVSQNIPSHLTLLDGWFRFSHKNQAGFGSSHSSIFNIPYWRWTICGEFDEIFGPVIPYETQGDIKRPDVQIFPRYTWGDFEALSSCWESENLEKEIILDGNITKVPKNLEAALRALGKLPETRMRMKFWVDYLCIYLYRSWRKHLGYLRHRPLFSKEFSFFNRSRTRLVFNNAALGYSFLDKINILTYPSCLLSLLNFSKHTIFWPTVTKTLSFIRLL